MTITPVQTDYYRFLEGFSVQEMFNEVRKWLGVSADDTTRYSDADILLALNFGQERFAKLTRCLLMPTIIICKSGWQHYRMPFNSLAVVAARYYQGTSASDYTELEIIESMKKMQRKDAQFRGTAGDPRFLFPSYRAGNLAMVGVSPIPTSDGTAWSADDYGVVSSANGITNAGNITGSHKTGYGSSAFLVDSAGRNFSTLGSFVGITVFNTTKNESMQVTAIGDQDATNDKLSGTLSGSADWDEGDAFEIYLSEYGVVIDATGDESYFYTTYLGTIANIYAKTGNMYLDIARKPLPLNINNLGTTSEIPYQYQDALLGYAVYWLGHRAYKGVVQAEKAGEGMALFNERVAEYDRDELAETSDKQVEDRSWEWLS